jgi:hypothetical protein
MKKYIDLQLESNQSKNLFYKDFFNIMKFSQLPFDIFQSKKLSTEDLDSLIHYTAEKVLQEFYRVNQYYSFSENNILALKYLYLNLYQAILKKQIPIDTIFKYHFANLQHWLEETNSFSRKLYGEHDAILDSVVCSEYSSRFQKNILCLNKIDLLEPILDIGCGENASLVKSFIAEKMDAYGIDRGAGAFPYCKKADWLTYNYGMKKWGTIVSNLGFSNHFVHHHLRDNGNIIQYAEKYLEILQSLQIGGSFCYAPDLPFIEMYLDTKTYSIAKYNIGNVSFRTTIVTRLK